MYSNYLDAMQWLEDTDVLEMIVDKFGSSVGLKSKIQNLLLVDYWYSSARI